MISTVDFLAKLRSLGIKVSSEGGALRYKAPKGTLTPDLIAELRSRKAEIIEFLNQFDTAPSSNLPPIKPQSRDSGEFPLSWAQERLWFIDQLEPDSITYNIPIALRLEGNLKVSALEQALAEIVSRHEVLRTSFPAIEGQPKQVIAPTAKPIFKIVDLSSDLEPEQRDSQLQQLLQQEISRPFNLASDLLIRSHLWQLSNTEYVLLVNMHHIVADGWSIKVFRQELSSLYRVFSEGKTSSLPELAIQYKDFALWQRDCLQGKIGEKQLNYWQQQLDNTPELLPLPIDRPRPSTQTYQGKTYSFSLSEQLSQKLKELSTQSGTTLFMTLQGAFSILLSRLCGESDILIGSPIANRNRNETEGLIGFFVNTLVLRTKLENNPSFAEVLKQVRETTLAAYENQDIGLEQIVKTLQLERSLSHSPLFQVMFVLQNTPNSELELPGVKVKQLKVTTETAKFDLTLSMTESSTKLVGSWNYNTNLFNDETIERISGHFQTLLSAIVENPQQKINQLPLLTEAEKHHLLVDWNDTEREYPHNKSIHQLFEEQVRQRPKAIAVKFANQDLSYQQLNQRANQLAHYLQTRGVKPGVLVGICLERSPEMLVALLAILKAGGAYVPLDPNYPADRLAFMLEDTQVPILLTQQLLTEKFLADKIEIFCLDTDWKTLNSENTDNPASKAIAKNIAYVTYTSGSTGRPKGVCVSHQAVSRLLFNTNYIKLEPNDKIAQISNISFDAATFEIWGSLLHGGKLVIISQDIFLDPQKFAKQLREQEISVLFLTTALFNQLASIIPQAFKNLRYLLFGGESAKPQWVQEILKKAPPQNLLHVYGPTEGTTFSSWYLVENISEGATTIPIGRPISNTQIYILDKYLQPVPIGVVGELYIGGDGLAEGYLNQTELTKEKFISNPFLNSQLRIPHSEKLYKTGDLARYLRDGNIDFCGRTDNQFKIRGFRIELGEVESTLAQHPLIKECAILAKEESSASRQLVAYLVFRKNSTPNTEEIRNFLGQKLPNYMIPSSFIVVDDLPLTANGKVNSRALLNLDLPQQESKANFVAPRSELEIELAQIWEQVLKINPIGIKDNFFDLGGHSLLAISLFAQINNRFGNNFPLSTIFKTPNIEELAKKIADCRTNYKKLPTESNLLVAIQPNGTKTPFFCIHAGHGQVLFYQKLAKYLDSDQPLYALEPQGLNDPKQPLTKFEDMAALYIEEMRKIQPHGPYLICGYCIGGVIAYEIAQQLRLEGDQIALLAFLDAYPKVQKSTSNYLLKSFDRFLKLGFKARLIRLIRKPLKLIFNKLLGITWKISPRLSLSFPESWKREYFYFLHAKALYEYQPKIFPDYLDVVNFRATQNLDKKTITSSWNGLIKENIENYDMQINHFEMIRQESALEEVANKLTSCLKSPEGVTRQKETRAKEKTR